MESIGVVIEKTAVGDRYVLERMLENSYNLGGEQSGHVIMRDFSNTGDWLAYCFAGYANNGENS